MGSLICHKCHNGTMKWIDSLDDDSIDLGDKRTKCETCGKVWTLKTLDKKLKHDEKLRKLFAPLAPARTFFFLVHHYGLINAIRWGYLPRKEKDHAKTNP